MAIGKVLAQLWKLYIKDNSATPVYIEVKGLDTITPNISGDRIETPDFQSGAWKSYLKVQQGMEITIDGYYLVDESTGDRDPGQAAMDAIGRLTGQEAFADFRLTCAGGSTIEFQGLFAPGSFGGGSVNESARWGGVVTINGEPTFSE